MPVSVMSFFTSLSENRETLLIENPANALWKLGHLFSITFQFRPAVKSDLVMRSKYSSSFVGGFVFQLGDTDLGSPVEILRIEPGFFEAMSTQAHLARYIQLSVAMT